MFNEFVETAKTTIKTVPEPYKGNRYYLRNRITEISVYLAVNSPQHESKFHEYCKADIAECQERADHYGVKIGEPTGKRIRHRRSDYYNQVAKYTRLIKNSIDIDSLPDL